MLAVPHAVILAAVSDLYSAFAAIRVVDALWPRSAPAATGTPTISGVPWPLEPCWPSTRASSTPPSVAPRLSAPVALCGRPVGLSDAVEHRDSRSATFSWAVMCHPLSWLLLLLLLHTHRATVCALTTVLLVPAARLASQASAAAGPTMQFRQPPRPDAAERTRRRPVCTARQRNATCARPPLPRLQPCVHARGRYTHRLPPRPPAVLSAPQRWARATPGPLALAATALVVRWPPGRAQPRPTPWHLGSSSSHHKCRSLVTRPRPSHRGRRLSDRARAGRGARWGVAGPPTARRAHRGAGRSGQQRVGGAGDRLRDAAEHTAPGTGMVQADHRDTWSIWMGTPAQVVPGRKQTVRNECTSGRSPVGSLDGLALVHPERGAARVETWWACHHP